MDARREVCTEFGYRSAIKEEAIGSGGVGAVMGRPRCTRVGRNSRVLSVKTDRLNHIISTNS